MSKICAIVVMCIAFAIGATSCKKKAEVTPIVPAMSVPGSDAPWAANLMSTSSSANLSLPVSNVWGVFLLVRLESGFPDTSGQPQYHYEDWEEAFFCGDDGTGLQLPKSVSLNGSGFAPSGDHYFTQSLWRSGMLNHWEVTHTGNIPEVSANIMDEYPNLNNAAYPDKVSRSGGLSYTFVPAQAYHADSGYVLIHANGLVVRSNTVSVKYGATNTATISKDLLTNLQNEYFTVDGKVFKGGVMEVVVFKDSIQTFEDKQFLFRSQREIVRKVTFN